MSDTEQQIDLYVEKSRCHEHTELTFEEVIGLTGILGVYPDFDFTYHHTKCTLLYNPTNKTISVDLYINCIRPLTITIYLTKGNRWIEIDLLLTQQKDINNLALRLVREMAKNCIKHDIKEITLTAARGIGRVGDIIWGLVGFIPDRVYTEQFIDPIIKEYNELYRKPDALMISSLYELLACEYGRALWINKGHFWTGTMIIDKTNPYGNKLLEQALKRKGLQ